MNSDNATATGLAGVALGVLTEEQAYAALQYAILSERIQQIAADYAAGEIGVYGMRDAMKNAIDEIQNLPDPFGDMPQKAADAAEGVTTAIEEKFDRYDFDAEVTITEPELSPLEQKLADLTKEDTAGSYEIDIISNADAVENEDIDPLQRKVEYLVQEPYNIRLKSNALDQQTQVSGLISLYGKIPPVVTTTVRMMVQTIYDNYGGPNPGPGGQHGLDMMVPPGYPNDTFPFRASTGERVLIQTPAQQRSGEGSSVDNSLHVHYHNAVYGEDHLKRTIDKAYDQKTIKDNIRSRTR